MEACPFTIRKEVEQTVSLEEMHPGSADAPREEHAPQRGGLADAPREEHASQRASTSSAAPVVCEAAETEGVYGPWMVVKRRSSGRKATKPSLGAEGTAIPVCYPSPYLPPKNSERMGTSPSGPGFSHNMSHVGVKQNNGDHVSKAAVGRLSKASGLRETSHLKRGSTSISGPLKSSPSPSEQLEVNMGLNSHSEPGPSSIAHKRTPSSVRGKKTLARGSHPKPNIDASATHQWKFSSTILNTLSAANNSSHTSESFKPPDNTFEFVALEKNGSDQLKGSSDTHYPVARKANPSFSDGQKAPNGVGNGAEVTGLQSDLGSREGSDYEDVGDERMASEEGDGVPFTV